MKSIDTLKTILLSTCFTLVCHSTLAKEGGSGPGGGGLEMLYQADIGTEKNDFISIMTSELQSPQFKEKMIAYLTNINFLSSIANKNAKDTLQLLLQNGLISHIQKSPAFNFQNECLGEIILGSGVLSKRTLSTESGTLDQPSESPICVDVNDFVITYLSTANYDESDIRQPNKISFPFWQWAGLFLHDYARHFGINDQDHKFASSMSTEFFKNEIFVENVTSRNIKRNSNTFFSDKKLTLNLFVSTYANKPKVFTQESILNNLVLRRKQESVAFDTSYFDPISFKLDIGNTECSQSRKKTRSNIISFLDISELNSSRTDGQLPYSTFKFPESFKDLDLKSKADHSTLFTDCLESKIFGSYLSLKNAKISFYNNFTNLEFYNYTLETPSILIKIKTRLFDEKGNIK